MYSVRLKKKTRATYSHCYSFEPFKFKIKFLLNVTARIFYQASFNPRRLVVYYVANILTQVLLFISLTRETADIQVPSQQCVTANEFVA